MDATGTPLGTLDLLTVAVYLAVILAHGIYVGRGAEGADDYFLAGRRLSFGLIGLSLYASNMSGASFVGLMGASYSHGLAVFHYEWTATVVLAFFAVFMLPVFLRARIHTLPEYLELRFDRRCRLAFSGFTIGAVLFIDTAGALYAGGLVVHAVFPDWSLSFCITTLALLAGGYTTVGGLSAVVVTDAMQAVLLVLGAAVIFGVGLHELGGWDAFTGRLTEAQTALVRPLDDAFLPLPGILGVVLLGFYYWTLNQFVVQRTLGARDLASGQKGALLAGLLKLPNLFLMIVPGLMAALLFPNLATPDLAFPKLAFELLPLGLRGLILSAVLAAIMSSLDSALNAAASLVTYDFVQHARPKLTDRQLVRWGRGTTATFMVVATLFAPNIRHFDNLFGYFQSSLSYVTPPIVAVYLAGLFVRRATARRAFFVLIGSWLIGVPAFVAIEVLALPARWGLPSPHFSYAAVALFTLAFAAITLGAPPPKANGPPGRDEGPSASDAIWSPHRLPTDAWKGLLPAIAASFALLIGLLTLLF